MILRVDLPRLSAAMEGGTLIRWHKNVGDTVAFGEDLCDIQVEEVRRITRRLGPLAAVRGKVKTGYRTTKGGVAVRFRLSSMEQGVLAKILAPVGSRLESGTSLALITGTDGLASKPPEVANLHAARVKVNVLAPGSEEDLA